MLWFTGLNLQQQRLNQRLDHGQFIDQGGVKHNIRIFLVRKDPGVLALPYFWPTAYRFFGTITPMPGIANDPAEQPGIRGRDPVVTVEVELRQGRNVDSEYPAGWNVWYQIRVHTVDPLNQDHMRI